MEKTTKYAHIPEINGGLVFSDPWYDETVWCQHRCNFDTKDWYLRLETGLDEDNYIDMTLLIGRPSLVSQLYVEKGDNGDDRIFVPSRFEAEEYELGVDTAKIYLGNVDNFCSEASIRTGADGSFGGLFELTCKNQDEPTGYLLLSLLDSRVIDEQELFHTLLASFNAEEISPELYKEKMSSLSTKAQIAWEEKLAKEGAERAPNQTKSDPER